MLFWILIALLTAAACLSVLMPLTRGRKRQAPETGEQDAAIYREQLQELEREIERGQIEGEAAEAARIEIARRLLEADQRRTAASTAGKARKGVSAAMVSALVIVFVPVVAMSLYLMLGSPEEPDQPLLARLSAPADDQPVDVLIARVERHLSDNPEDGRGWEVLAPVYMRIGRPEDAARAYSNTLRLLGDTPGRLSGYGEALTVANGGVVDEKAHAAFEAANKLDPTSPKPRFYLAIALAQEGRTDDAIAAWTSLLADAQPGASWVPVAEAELKKLGGTPPVANAGSATTAPPAVQSPGEPNSDAKALMANSDTAQMVQQMVSGLDERLRADGGTADEWSRLITSYMVLGKPDTAKEIVTLARQDLADDQDALAKINALASEKGL